MGTEITPSFFQDRPRAIVIDIEAAESTNAFRNGFLVIFLINSRNNSKSLRSHAGILSILKIMYPGQNISDKVSAIEFENANVIANANNKDERWIIEVLCVLSRVIQLARSGFCTHYLSGWILAEQILSN